MADFFRQIKNRFYFLSSVINTYEKEKIQSRRNYCLSLGTGTGKSCIPCTGSIRKNPSVDHRNFQVRIFFLQSEGSIQSRYPTTNNKDNITEPRIFFPVTELHKLPIMIFYEYTKEEEYGGLWRFNCYLI